MIPDRSFKSRSISGIRHQPNARRSMSYYKRPASRRQARPFDGVVEARPQQTLIPTSQEEYIASLAGAPQKLSRFRGPLSEQDANNSLDIKMMGTLKINRHRFRLMKVALPVFISLVIVVSLIIGPSSLRSGKTAEANRAGTRSSVESAIDYSDEISERRPTNIEDYQVSEDLPRFLRINGMGLSARVRRVGVGTKTELRLPSNIYDVGWYENSAKPGEDGAIVLTGHTSGPTKPGVFHDLDELEPGDKFELEAGNGNIYYYYVAKLEAFEADDSLEPLLVSAIPGTPALNLITESGHYDEKSSTYDQRLVVYAVQDQNVQDQEKQGHKKADQPLALPANAANTH